MHVFCALKSYQKLTRQVGYTDTEEPPVAQLPYLRLKKSDNPPTARAVGGIASVQRGFQLKKQTFGRGEYKK